MDLGVMPMLGHKVVDIDDEAVTVSRAAETVRIPTRAVIWAAGIVASPLGAELAAQSAAAVDRGGRVEVGPQLTLPGRPEVMVIGDMASVHDDQDRPVPLPGLAPVAMQQGRHAAGVIAYRLAGRGSPPFRYRDKGNLATIGRAKAVAQIKHLQLSGLPAWLTWLFVHLFYLIGLQNRLIVLIRWAFSFVTRAGGARLIIIRSLAPPARAREIEDVGDGLATVREEARAG
jgi:NADH dehydrogenase